MFHAAWLSVAALSLAGCDLDVRRHTGPAEHDSRVLDLGKAEMARLELNMGAGELKVAGGSLKLLEADFDYNIPAWKPIMTANTSGFRADVKVEQPGRGPALGNVEYKWKLRITDQLPWDVVTHLGAGEAEMELGSTPLRSVEVHMGVGHLRLDLRGTPKRSFDVEIHGGVGEADVYLPKSAAISATAHGGIGEISVQGLEKRGDRWINREAENARASIRLVANGGVGSIRIVAE